MMVPSSGVTADSSFVTASDLSQYVHCNDLDILFVESFQPLVAVEESQLLLTTSFLGNSGHRK
jgi:hypothetical protein